MTSERDPALERAWRAQSRETPPPELDRAILAAAHRAVGSGPQDAGKAPAATRPQRWWMPLAAAATIGVVAVGVMQSLPEDQLVSTTPQRSAAMNERKIEDKVAAPAPAESANVVTQRDAQPATKSAEPAKATTELAQKKKQDAPAATPAPVPAPSPPAASTEKDRASVSGKLTSAPEPFPAAPAPRKTEADAKAALPAGASGGAPADAVAPVPKAPPATELQERKDSGLQRQQELAAAPAAQSPPPPAQAAAGTVSSFAQTPASTTGTRPMAPAPSAVMAKRARESSDSRSEPSAAEANAPAKNLADADEYRAKARDPDAWIVQIRKLRDEGHTADALRELREFRARVPDAEKRLPADLRDWSAAMPK